MSILSLINFFQGCKGVISNEIINKQKVLKATKIISDLQNDLVECINNGSGPFLALILDSEGNEIARAANSVICENCSNNHAEVNVIKLAQNKLNNYDLSSYDLSLYVTSEPCIMCLGAIMWSGIKNVYYGVPSKIVEKITGFDEGFKPNWFSEFSKRGIKVYGNIAVELGVSKLEDYVKSGKTIYKPSK